MGHYKISSYPVLERRRYRDAVCEVTIGAASRWTRQDRWDLVGCVSWPDGRQGSTYFFEAPARRTPLWSILCRYLLLPVLTFLLLLPPIARVQAGDVPAVTELVLLLGVAALLLSAGPVLGRILFTYDQEADTAEEQLARLMRRMLDRVDMAYAGRMHVLPGTSIRPADMPIRAVLAQRPQTLRDQLSGIAATPASAFTPSPRRRGHLTLIYSKD